jgi:protocatechuate 3,4-dioxygenase alpha subunit
MTDASSHPGPFLQTPSQTIGPFFAFALPYAGGPHLVPQSHPSAIRLHGTVLDGAGQPVPDAVVEIWHADEDGVLPQELGSLDRDGYTFTGFGRDATTRAGRYGFTTVKPGSVDGRAPVVLVTIFARGLTHHLFTRVYFPEDFLLHSGDAVLTAAGDRASTMVAVAGAPGEYRFDIHLQGSGEDRSDETVFLDFD